MATESITFSTEDQLRLEGRLSLPDEIHGAAVLCHPHPLYGGTMSSAIIPALQRALRAVGWASLRFNFRGVGGSEGRFGRGVDEVLDVRAAMETIVERVGDVPRAIAGWSFGSLVGLATAVEDPSVGTYVGIAPPVTVRHNTALPALPPEKQRHDWSARVLLVAGTEDEFCQVDDLRPWAAELHPDATVTIYEGEDHFFSNDKHAMAGDVAAFVAGGAA